MYSYNTATKYFASNKRNLKSSSYKVFNAVYIA